MDMFDKREKADRLYHYTDIPVKDYLTGLVASILGKIFRTSTTKRPKKINPNRIHSLKLQLVSILFERLMESSESRNWNIQTYVKYVFNLLWKYCLSGWWKAQRVAIGIYIHMWNMCLIYCEKEKKYIYMHFFFTIDRTHIVTVVKLKIKFG